MPKPIAKGKQRTIDPRLFIPWSAAASRDRLSSTLFIAGLFHGIILLGVTFTSDDLPAEPQATSFDVVLVTGDYEDNPQVSDAELLAQQNMAGAGNTELLNELQTALTQTQQAEAVGPQQSGAREEQFLETAQTQERPTIVARSVDSQLALPELRDDQQFSAEQQARAFVGETQTIEVVNQPSDRTLISDTDPRELVISANTSEARIAAYLSKWKTQVERVGTRNFPNAGQNSGLVRFPTLEVAIDSDGELREVVILESSGAPNLDQAAMNSVNLSAPFDPFPQFLQSDYDVLRFSYQWRFTDESLSARGYNSTRPQQSEPE